MTDRDERNIARRRQLEADLAAKAAQLLNVQRDHNGPLWIPPDAPPEATPQEAAPQEAAPPIRRLPAVNPAQGSSASGTAPEPESTTTKARQLAQLQTQMKRASR